MESSEARLYQIFRELEITEYCVHEHKAVFTSEEARREGLTMEGLNLKNLLVKDKKNNRFYLLVLEDRRHMDEKHFKKVTGWGKIRFAREEELWELLKLKPGSVSPYGLINDRYHQVAVVLDTAVLRAGPEEKVNFHPNRNTATLSVKKEDFLKFLAYTKNKIIWETDEEA